MAVVFCLNRPSDEFFHQFFQALKCVFTESRKIKWSSFTVSFWRLDLVGGARSEFSLYTFSILCSFWPGAFASIDICRLLTGLFGYCVYSLLADHIDRWLPKSFTEKWDYETYLACNCGTYLKRRYEILWRPFLTLSSLEVKAGTCFLANLLGETLVQQKAGLPHPG